MANRRIPLAWMNLVHEPIRLLVATGGIGFAVVLMFMQLGFSNALFDSTVAVHESLLADLVMTSNARYTLSVKETFTRRRLSQAEACDGVESARPLYVETALSIWKNPQTHQGYPIRVLAFDPTHPVLDLPGLREQMSALQSPGGMLVDRRSKDDYGKPVVGNMIELANHKTRVVGIFDLGTDFSNDGNVILNDRDYSSYFTLPGAKHDKLADVDVGLIKLKKGVDASKVLAEVQKAVGQDVLVQTKQQFIDRELKFWRNSTPIGFIFILGTVMGFIVGVVICYQILYSDIDDHMPEFATLKAMGYANRYFVSVVLQESLWLSIFGFLPGILVAEVLYKLLSWNTGLLLDFSARRVIGVLLLTVMMCVGSGCLALRRVFQADPAELF